jgi:uncharacterized OsmC-like protein
MNERQGKVSSVSISRIHWRATILRSVESSVGFATMEDGVNAENVGMFFGKTHAVVANAQAKFAGLSPELFHIAFTGCSKAVQRSQDAHCGLAIDAAHVSLSGDSKDNSPHAFIVAA